jgi:hypothetical protein
MTLDDEPAIAWTAMPYRAKVVAADDSVIGPAESLLGDEQEDIFHGIVVRHAGKHLEIAAARIKKITSSGVVTDLGADEVAALPQYREEKWFHIGWGGVFRKHPQWDKTSNP